MIIPFFIPHAGCPHQCVFCNQKGITGKIAQPDPDSFARTIRSYLGTKSSDGRVQVAFYGGSFTALPRDQQRSYLEAVRPFIASGKIDSIRISTRPDSINADTVTFLKEHHVSTIELGAQSMDDRVLLLSGRGHCAADTVHAVQVLREHDFAVGLQLMPGLPGDSAETFDHTVVRVIDLRPDLVRVYPTLIIRDTPLEALYRTGRYIPLSLVEAAAWCRGALRRFEKAGISVIRMGLQPSEELERPGTIVAGPYHPAFRQIVESSLLLEKMRALLAPAVRDGKDITLYVNPGDLSTAIGQQRRNVQLLRKEFSLASIAFEPDSSIPKGQVRSHPS